MKFTCALLCIPLALACTLSWGDESKYSGNFLGLDQDSNPFSNQHIVEFWGYHDYLGSADYSDTLKLRYYQPLQIDSWQGTMRLDTSYVSNYGPLQPTQSAGSYSAGNTLLTVWGTHPDIFTHWGGTLGGRVIFPFGNNGQWAVGPQAGSVYHPAEGSNSVLADFSPLARYMYGFATNSASSTSQPPPLRRLDLYPTLGFAVTPDTQIRFWDENGINYNTAGGGWFVPIDAMVTHRLNKHFLVALGASKEIVQTYQQYNWSVYGKLSLNF